MISALADCIAMTAAVHTQQTQFIKMFAVAQTKNETHIKVCILSQHIPDMIGTRTIIISSLIVFRYCYESLTLSLLDYAHP